MYDSEPHFALYKALIGRPLFTELVAACNNVFHNITPGEIYVFTKRALRYISAPSGIGSTR